MRYAYGRFNRARAEIEEEREQACRENPNARMPPIDKRDYSAKGAMFIPERARYDYLLKLPNTENIGAACNNAMAILMEENPQLSGVLPNTYTELGDELLREVLRIFNNPALDEEGDDANTFYNDVHNLCGKCTYVAANPPFNVDKVKYAKCVEAGRLPLGAPKENKHKEVSTSGANYLWINYFYSYLNERGRAGFVMASSATDSNAERGIRKKLVQSGHVDVMLYVGNNFFYTKSLPCTLWFFNKAKAKDLQDKVLFIDAQRYHTEVSTTLNEWTPHQLKNLTAIVWLYRGEVGKYHALIEEYKQYAADVAGLFEGAPAGVALKSTTCTDDFKKAHTAMLEAIEAQKSADKKAVEALPKNKQKRERERLAEKVANMQEAVTGISEAVWLTEKFGMGDVSKYADVPGLCKIATRADIQGDVSEEKSSWSLTPGAYVGVPPAEDDGVNFEERMAEIHAELRELQEQSNTLASTIDDNFKKLGL